jgi:hypothetical protein
VKGTAAAKWEVIPADTANAACFCVSSTVTFTDGRPATSGSECYKIDANGAVIGNRITIPGPCGKPAVFMN